MKPSAAQLCLRPYEEGDLQAVVSLFYDTIHSVNLKDYTPEQADAWAPKKPDLSRWQGLLKGEDTWVAVQDGRIVGFATGTASTSTASTSTRTTSAAASPKPWRNASKGAPPPKAMRRSAPTPP